MPPPCQSANTPAASGAAATRDSVNGRLEFEIDILSSPTKLRASYACRGSGTARETKQDFSALVAARHWHSGCRRNAMPLKPNGRMCRVREQIIEDSASGLTLQFECDDGRLRLVIAGAPLKLGNREIFFDEEGREAGAGT